MVTSATTSMILFARIIMAHLLYTKLLMRSGLVRGAEGKKAGTSALGIGGMVC